jgi:surfeit locus 1 family protein
VKPLRTWLVAIAAVAGMAAAAWLGAWQWGRAHEKIALQAAVQARQTMAPLGPAELLAGPAEPELLHRAVEVSGQWLPAHTVFLDNRQMQGRPGFYVVTPLRLSGSQAVVLVQRGWAPRNFIDRAALPAVQTPTGQVTVRGRMAPAPSKLYELGPAGVGPIRQNLDLAAFRAETGLALIDGSILQTGEPSEGLLRDWPAPASSADKNYGYAFQWWAIGSVIFILYVWFQFIAPRRRPAEHA